MFSQFLKLRKVVWHFYDQKFWYYVDQLKIEIANAEKANWLLRSEFLGRLSRFVIWQEIFPCQRNKRIFTRTYLLWTLTFEIIPFSTNMHLSLHIIQKKFSVILRKCSIWPFPRFNVVVISLYVMKKFEIFDYIFHAR